MFLLFAFHWLMLQGCEVLPEDDVDVIDKNNNAGPSTSFADLSIRKRKSTSPSGSGSRSSPNSSIENNTPGSNDGKKKKNKALPSNQQAQGNKSQNGPVRDGLITL